MTGPEALAWRLPEYLGLTLGWEVRVQRTR
jgi:hypothetical protein